MVQSYMYSTILIIDYLKAFYFQWQWIFLVLKLLLKFFLWKPFIYILSALTFLHNLLTRQLFTLSWYDHTFGQVFLNLVSLFHNKMIMKFIPNLLLFYQIRTKLFMLLIMEELDFLEICTKFVQYVFIYVWISSLIICRMLFLYESCKVMTIYLWKYSK